MRSVMTYDGAHQRVHRIRGKASAHMCFSCGARKAKHWAYDHEDANARQGTSRSGTSVYVSEFSSDPSHYLPLCVPCHYRFDHQQRTAIKGGRTA